MGRILKGIRPIFALRSSSSLRKALTDLARG
ncbi:hypothetical protein J3A64_000627 [Pseudarthrobacter sp. PvP004]|nr:hypothetical protein [Pseudarthrobacter sp. PvP004]